MIRLRSSWTNRPWLLRLKTGSPIPREDLCRSGRLRLGSSWLQRSPAALHSLSFLINSLLISLMLRRETAGPTSSRLQSSPCIVNRSDKFRTKRKSRFFYKGADGKQHRNSAIEGTRIFVGTTRREDVEIEANAQIELHALPNRYEIPLTEDHVLSRPPEQTVTTMALSGILKNNSSTWL